MENKELQQIVEPLLQWYRTHARVLPWRESRDPYGIWVSEIMLQQTRVEAVKPYYRRFMEALPDIRTLAAAEEEQLLKLWEGLGYYNRVRNLQKAAQIICRDHEGRFPQRYEEMRKLPGIGEYTAGAISSIAFDLPIPAVDGNVLRVLARVTEDARPMDQPKVRKELTLRLKEIYPQAHCGDFTQSLMELGATVCLPKGEPNCAGCPLQKLCRGSLHDSWKYLPIKKKKMPRKIQNKTLLHLEFSKKLGLRKRENTGLLAGLWELPSVEGHLTAEEVKSCLETQGIGVDEIRYLGEKKHIFSHVEWRMLGYWIVCRQIMPSSNLHMVWATEEEVTDTYSLPAAFRHFL